MKKHLAEKSKKYRRVISHDTEEWSTHFLFEKWHEKFDEF